VHGHTGLSSRLAERIAQSDEGEPVEVVIELANGHALPGGSRQERIAAARTAFEHDLASVEGTITAAGGKVLDAAWLNRTVLGRVPVGALRRIAADEHVAAVDLPRPVEADAPR